MKINKLLGDLTVISAETKTLVSMLSHSMVCDAQTHIGSVGLYAPGKSVHQ